MARPSASRCPQLVALGDSPSGDLFTCHICQKAFTYQRMLNRYMKCHNNAAEGGGTAGLSLVTAMRTKSHVHPPG
ncbi:putative transcription factor Ovo-like 1 [Saccopteryx leptura]|uniref:putative transcription factor Ovo-like 1 n=1 Tax=Saccopteryx leptura TaxID=249018 RepID=UPI00339C6D7F